MLPVGSRIGSYEVLAAIGAGGMGEVYRARDTRLKREVALKLLPQSFAGDAERLARFQREAEILAALNHPNIAAIHGVEEGAGDGGTPVHALVLELVDGETLADRIARGPLPLDEALGIARQIADALEAAHGQGIVHRDLKPANIKVRDDGTVKVLDFGLAKLAALPEVGSYKPAGARPYASPGGGVLRADLTASPTITSPAMMTGVGTLLGTAAYMSPEQAKGRPADTRSDVWAFGCVLYEMLTGRRAFDGEDVSDTLASILKSEPAPHALPNETPSAVRRLLRRCLEKEPRRRLQHIGDARLEIEEAAALSASEVAPAPAWHRRRTAAWIAGLGVAALTGAALSGLMLRSGGTADTVPFVTRLAVPVAPATQVGRGLAFPNARPFRVAIALSPDGRTLAFVGERPGEREDGPVAAASALRQRGRRGFADVIEAGVDPNAPERQLYLRSLDGREAAPIPGTEGAESPFFSPDGQWIGFWQPTSMGDDPGELKKVSVRGGPVERIARIPMPGGISWAPDGRIVFATQRAGGLWQVPDTGGTPQPLTEVDPAAGELHHRLPHVLPGARTVLFTVQTTAGGWDDSRVVVRTLDDGAQKTIVENAADARYVEGGYLVYARMGTLFAQRFDVARLEVSGTAVAVENDVMQDVNSRFAIGNSGAAQFSISAAGSLAYLPGGLSPAGSYVPVWVDRNGATEEIGVPRRFIVGRPRVSPDGTRIAFQTGNAIGIFDIPRGLYHQLTPAEIAGPDLSVVLRVIAWHPDGERIAFTGRDGRLFWIAADGSSPAEPLTDVLEQSGSMRRVQLANSWSKDGSTLAFIQRDETAGSSSSDIWLLSFVDGRPAGARPFRNTPADEVAVEFSPDGRSLAYQVSEGDRAQVYVEPYPGPGRREVISSDAGLQPLWRRDGRELFYLGRPGDRISMMAVAVTAGERLDPSRPQPLWDAPAIQYPTGLRGRVYDIMPDGKRFVMIQQRDDFSQPPITHIVLVQHWVEELKRLLPVP